MPSASFSGPAIDPIKLIEHLIISTREGTTFWFKNEFILDTMLPGGSKATFLLHYRDERPRWQLFIIHSDKAGELFRATRHPDEPDPGVPTLVDQLFAAVLQSSIRPEER